MFFRKHDDSRQEPSYFPENMRTRSASPHLVMSVDSAAWDAAAAIPNTWRAGHIYSPKQNFSEPVTNPITQIRRKEYDQSEEVESVV